MLDVKVVVCNTHENEEYQQVSDDAMLEMSAGVKYHARLNTIFVIKSELKGE